jgi:hypothetical protein
MTGKLIGWFVAVVVFVLVVVAHGEQKEQKAEQSEKTTVELLMQDKLEHVKSVLDGMVNEDYDKISEHAEMLGLISRAASWHVVDLDEYDSFSDRFQQASTKLLGAAKQENRDAVTLQYLQLTLSCIECHQYLHSQEPK